MIRTTQRIARVLATFLAVTAGTALTQASASIGSEDEPTLQQREEEVLQVLRTGTPDERLEAADLIVSTLGRGVFSEEDDSRSPEDLVDGLILFLHQETDDWIARTLLDSLLWDKAPAMNRLFREALRSESINIQAMAVRQFSYREDPEALEALESLWKRDLPPWVRAELIATLAEQGSTAHLDGIMRLTRDDDPEVREAAIEALDTLAQPETIPVLVRVARHGTPKDRAAALHALGAFPDSDEALQEAIRATRSDDRPIVTAAVAALGRLSHTGGDSRLIALLDDPPDPDLRGAIANALEDSTHTDATAALVRLLHQRDVGTDSWITSMALQVLHNRDDPAAVPALRDLAGPAVENEPDKIGDLIDYLSRDRSIEGPSVVLTSACSFGSPVLPENSRAWHVAPPAPWASIRCWAGPERVGDPEDRQRIPAGTLVLIDDHFEAGGESWVEINGSGVDACWVPQDQLRQGPGPGVADPWNGRRIRLEFDIGTEELDSPLALRLTEAGLLEVFEPGDEVAGAALEIDVSEEEQLGLARALRSDADTVLDSFLSLLLDLAESDE